MLKVINQKLVEKMLNIVAESARTESTPFTLAFGFDAEDYEGEWRECRTALMRQVIVPLLQRYEISDIAFYDDLSFEFTIEEVRETFI